MVIRKLKKVLHQEFASLNELQTFNLDELLKHMYFPMMNRNFLLQFKYIQISTNKLAQLFVKNNLNGTHRYGSVNYLVKLNNIAVLVNKIKMEDIFKGIVQAIMQLHSMKKKFKLDQTDFNSLKIFGIIMTGNSWHFIH
ncbi:hypothetical protein RhiirC2_790678 [Rhizophagus irregularis]|uniref:Uncharacterized protein n=1 Tax=Rhizophagus irregularis TaxID=588596 RepID=A0A2N1MKR7_9GLOM|nr:hypothetical protein RhiirC2_790678 [Rhizophagus irregularis]